MSELDDRPTAGGAGGAPAADPLARIGARLIDAAVARRRRRRHARQRLAGAALTLLLVATAAALALTRPFGGDGRPPTPATARFELPAGGGILSVWGDDATLCLNRPDDRGPDGTTICASAQSIGAMPPDRIVWTAAHRDGDAVVVTGLTTRDVGIVASSEPGGAVSVTARLSSRTVAVPGTGMRLVPFAITLHGVTTAHVKLVAQAATEPRRSVDVVAIDAPAFERGGWTAIDYSVPGGATPELVEQAQQRLAAAGLGVTEAVGSGARLMAATVEGNPNGEAVTTARMRAALVPGRLEVVDWERSALLPDGRTVADGLAHGSQRAITISRVADASHALTLTRARAQARRLGSGARVVQAVDHIRIPQPGPDDPRARFFVVRGGAALANTDLRSASRVDRGGSQQLQLAFSARGRERLHTLTRGLAQRGRTMVLPGRPLSSAAQHVAVIVDGRVVSVDPVDPARDPDGLDGGRLLVSGPFSGDAAGELATILRLGPLPPLTEIR